jgi:hypothetical protein
MICAVCQSPASHWAVVDGHEFSHCLVCGSVALNIEQMRAIDDGASTRIYNADYWESEARAARERSWGGSLARAAEAIYVSQRPVRNFVDIGSGDGSLLDSLSYHLPSFSEHLVGIELFPPEIHTQHPGYQHGSVEDLGTSVDCGVCIEVIEHLTPRMLRGLVKGLAERAEIDSCFLFNTGMGEYVLDEDKSYIDPINRGHIVSYGFPALETIFGEYGFRVSRLGSRSWAFIAEFRPSAPFDMSSRTWQPLPENVAVLTDPRSGSLMSILARESLRAYA